MLSIWCRYLWAMLTLVAVLEPSWSAEDLVKTPLPEGLVAKDTAPAAAAVICFLEGPAVDAEDNVFFSDIAGNRILKMDAKGKVTTFRADSGRTNGNCFDADGRLISCEGGEQGPGRRRIVRTDMKTGKVAVLTEKFDGKRYNSPNDCIVDGKGRVWFTDPRYGLDRSDLEMDVEGVYCIEGDKVRRLLTQKEIHRPNGIAVSPDDKTLYVIDSHPRVGGNRKVWAFDLAPDGSLSGQRVVYDFGKGRGGDGMRVDVDGNLWVAAGINKPRGNPGESLDVAAGVYVISPKGKLLGRIPIPEDLITNVAFGGPGRKTLFVTAGKTLYRFPVNVAGHAVAAPSKVKATRSPRQVAEQLAAVYGKKLDQVAYIPALPLVARLRLTDATNEPRYAQEVEKIVAPFLRGEKSPVPKSGSEQAGHLIFAELARRATGKDRERWVNLCRAAADQIFGKDGKALPVMPYHSEMSDAVFMAGPILAATGKLTGEPKYFDAAATHFASMRKRCLRSDGLYRHSPLCEAAWGRGNGFPALGLALALSDWPDDHPGKKGLIAEFQKHLAALLPHQDARTGCWHQVIDHPGSYDEYTCTCMIGFAMQRGMRLGWLKDEYQQSVEKAWRAIESRTGSDGKLVNVCPGTGKMKTLDDYLARPAINGRDDRGGAMGLMFTTELMVK